MASGLPRRRILVIVEPTSTLPTLFGQGSLRAWEAIVVHSYEQAHFQLQHDPCELVLLDESVYLDADAFGVPWLTRRCTVPLLLLADLTPEQLALAFEQGVTLWLPRASSLQTAQLLPAALERATAHHAHADVPAHEQDRLFVCQRRVDRLVSLLWRSAQTERDRRWFTQRHMLERLGEEIARADRHGSQLTVAVGEVRCPGTSLQMPLLDWVAERILASKRRCDIVGQYGPQGFIVLIVNTSLEGGLTYCRRVQRMLESDATAPHAVEVCFGLANKLSRSMTMERLLCQAEANLELARRGQNNRLVASMVADTLAESC